MSANIVIKTMTFSNILSYGKDVTVDFSVNPVTQLVGKNGAGKSSLATILEEALYNKNSRGIKKEELFNWNSPEKHYSITVDLTAGDDSYKVIKDVKSTAKVKLLKNSEDISGHTATQTYKLIEEIIGCDFTTFTKLVYQSIGSSLDFLRTTDANRKAFLTGLFSQEIYKTISEDVKKDVKTLKSQLDVESGKLSTVKATIDKASKMDFVEQELQEVEEFDDTPINAKVSELKVQAALVKSNDTKITKLRELDKNVQAAEIALSKLEETCGALPDKSKEFSEVTRELSLVTAEAAKVKTRYQTFKKQSEACNCPTCGREMDVTEAIAAAEIAKEEFSPLFEKRKELESLAAELKDNQDKVTLLKTAKAKLSKAQESRSMFDSGDLDMNMASVDVKAIEAEAKDLLSLISKTKSRIALQIEFNNSVTESNATKRAFKKQLEQAQAELDIISKNVTTLSEEVADLELIASSFKDLVAYKLEYSVKTFEEYINKYLSILTGGKFALGFELDATKLVVVVFNDGVKTSMNSCSTGQQHRIQLATLLAIRSLMSAISKVNINVLFLDEVISFIDHDGINNLVELLVEEHDLNSFLVSHGRTHPLARVITVEQDPQGNSGLTS